MTKIKVCGLMEKPDVDFCITAGVDILGFVVEYPIPVPWNLTIQEAKPLISGVNDSTKTCVVAGGTQNRILALADNLRPDIVQLHYKETLSEVSCLSEKLSHMGIKTIKALRINEYGKCDFEISDPVQAAKVLSDTGINAIAVDSYSESMPGGTGKTVNLDSFLLIQKESAIPVILAGGLNLENLPKIVSSAKPYAVDILTGVEIAYGKKDWSKISQIVREIKHL
jgi:phosphoribosylanthranilate isomerase